MIDLDKLAAEIHADGIKKGFWDRDKVQQKYICWMHSELSEAYAEDRNGMPWLYVDDIELNEPVSDINKFDGRKPEGVAAELADFVIVLLDYCAMYGTASMNQKYTNERGIIYSDVIELIDFKHYDVNFIRQYTEMSKEAVTSLVARNIKDIERFLKAKANIDLWQIVDLKVQYNQNRPYLHGRMY